MRCMDNMEYMVKYKSFKPTNGYIEKFTIVSGHSAWHAERVAHTKIRLTEKQDFEITSVSKYKATKIF